MKKLKLLWMILKRTKATQILSGYIVFLFASAAIIQLVEPDINRYGDALWYCYAVLSTAGFGDIVAMTFVGKLVSVLVTIYTIFVVAIVTGVVVNYYGQIVEMQRRETAMMFLDKLERLPELSKEELEDISKRVKNSAEFSLNGIFIFHFFLIFTFSIFQMLLHPYLSPVELMKLPVFLFHDVSDIKFQLQKIQQPRQNSP